jgi:hypothetical protein
VLPPLPPRVAAAAVTALTLLHQTVAVHVTGASAVRQSTLLLSVGHQHEPRFRCNSEKDSMCH